MTTIIDPASTPAVIFRSDDPVFYEIEATGSDESDAAQIVVYSSRTIVLMTGADGTKGVKLPSIAELGDSLELIGEPANPGVKVYDENGDFLGINVGRRLTRVTYGWT